VFSGLAISGGTAFAAGSLAPRPALAEEVSSHGPGRRHLDIESFPRRRGEHDDTGRLNRALDALPRGGLLTLGPDTYTISANLRWKSDITVAGAGDPTVLRVAVSNVNGVHLVGRTNVAVRSLTITGTGPGSGTGSGVILTDCTGCRLDDVTVDGFEHQGVVLGGRSTRNSLHRISSHNTRKAAAGTGVLLYGQDVAHNVLDEIYATGNRIGVSLNAAHDNQVGRVIAHDNEQLGFTIDGIGPGEGGTRNTVHSVIAHRNSSAATNWLGGVYLGNESNENVIDSIVCADNRGIGVYIRASRCVVGKVITLSSAVEGLRIWGHHNSVEQVISAHNATDGVRLYQADDNLLGNVQTFGNGGTGVRILGRRNTVSHASVTGNPTGIVTEPDSPGNVLDGVVLADNAVDVQDGSPLVLRSHDALLRIGAVPGLPEPSADLRGCLVRVEGGAGTADHVYVCRKNADGSYSWTSLDA
jgi:Right handed beta helix region